MVAGFALGPKGRLRSEAEQERTTGSTLEFWRSNKKSSLPAAVVAEAGFERATSRL